MKHFFLFIFLIFYFTFSAFARQSKIDSLFSILKITKDDSGKVNILNNLGDALWRTGNLKPALDYFEQAKTLSEKINYQMGMAKSYHNIGNIQLNKGDYTQALECYFRAIKISESIGDKNGLAGSYNNIGLVYWNKNDYALALKFYLKSLKIDEELGNKKGMAYDYNNIGNVYSEKGEFTQAMDFFFKVIKISEELGDKQAVAYAYNNIGLIYNDKGDYAQALNIYFKVLTIAEEIGDKQEESTSYSNIGNIYKVKGDSARALEFHYKALSIRIELEDKQGMSASYSNIGSIQFDKGDYVQALKNYFKTLKIAEEIGSKQGMAYAYNNIGNVYKAKNEYAKSLEFLLRSLKIKEEIGDKQTIASSHYNIGELYFRQGKIDMAELQGKNSLQIAKNINAKPTIMRAYHLLSYCDSSVKNWKGAYQNHQLYSLYKDSVFNEESNKQITEMQTKYDTEKKEQQIKLLNADKEKQAAVSAEQRKRLYIILSGSILLLIAASGFLSYYMRSNSRQKFANIELSRKNNTISRQKDVIESQKVIVEQKNRDILDSIEYASRIQQAIIPDDAEMGRVLGKEFFVFHRQKDIIGGDFYFVTEVHDEILIVVADCTGHGVPGAMLSMLGKDQLNELVNGKGITEPKVLLEKLDEHITLALNPNRKMEIPDGMDMAVIRMRDNLLGFSGANRPLVLVRNNELLEYKGARAGIGGGGAEKIFDSYNLELKKGDAIYLYTDGYADQSGGPKNSAKSGGKKFKSQRMKGVIKEISSKGMNEQKEVLQSTFEEWKGNGEQTDDVTVIGIRI